MTFLMEMYFSRKKRKTLRRVVICISVFLIASLILYSSPSTRQAICASPIIGYSCFGKKHESWNLFYHLGGNGPWISRKAEVDPGLLPFKCAVEQVHMISRHAERYPTKTAGARHISLLDKLLVDKSHLSGSLSFLRSWTYFTNLTDPEFENLTKHGPYAGTLQAFNTGRELRSRYDKLVETNLTTNIWSCSTPRDVETAMHFANGFFGPDWEQQAKAKLVVVPETMERGADTLTPGDTCLNYIKDKAQGHDLGYAKLAEWQKNFTRPIAERLAGSTGGLTFDPLEVYSMMEMCGFEILARGSSPWCDIFSHEEWLDFEYARDLLHFYRAGPGNRFSGAMGWLWLNATTMLMASDAASGVYFSFVHDGDIVPLLATLGIFNEAKEQGSLPTDRRVLKRKWKTSDVVPMGGRLILEKVTCSNTGLGENLKRSYIRLLVNDGMVDLEKSMVGGGLSYSMGIGQWIAMVRQKGKQFGSFKEVCGLADDLPTKITFLRPQYR